MTTTGSDVLLQTERLVLRRFTEADVDNLVELDGVPDVMRFINGGKPTPRGVVRDEILPRLLRYEGGYGTWAAVEKSSGEFLGWFELRPPDDGRPDDVELGYRLRKAAWGKGYATEGSRALIDKGFSELGVWRVHATTMTVNTASRRVMGKLGLTFVRTFFENWPEYIGGAEHGDVEYELRRADWERQRARSHRSS